MSNPKDLSQLLDDLPMPAHQKGIVQAEFRVLPTLSEDYHQRSDQYDEVIYSVDQSMPLEWSMSDMHRDLAIMERSPLWATILYVAFALLLKHTTFFKGVFTTPGGIQKLKSLAEQMNDIVHQAAIFCHISCDRDYQKRAWLEVIKDIRDTELLTVLNEAKGTDRRSPETKKIKRSAFWKEIEKAVAKRCGNFSANQCSRQNAPDETIQKSRSESLQDFLGLGMGQAAFRNGDSSQGVRFTSPLGVQSFPLKRNMDAVNQFGPEIHSDGNPSKKKFKGNSYGAKETPIDLDGPQYGDTSSLEMPCRAPIAPMLSQPSVSLPLSEVLTSKDTPPMISTTNSSQQTDMELQPTHIFHQLLPQGDSDAFAEYDLPPTIYHVRDSGSPSALPAREEESPTGHTEQSPVTGSSNATTQASQSTDNSQARSAENSTLDGPSPANATNETSSGNIRDFNLLEDMDFDSTKFETYDVPPKDIISMKLTKDSYLVVYEGVANEKAILKIFEKLKRNNYHFEAPSIRMGIHPDCKLKNESFKRVEIFPSDIDSGVNELHQQLTEERGRTIHFVVTVGQWGLRFS